MNTSPFKFLNAYEKEDKELFFGRSEETEALYEMTFDTRLILLYGSSGTGKTSLLQAGLANKFSETRWKDILIRRNDNINDSIAQNLRRELEKAGGNWPKEGLTPIAAIRQIQQLTFLPIYLIFDQFEELFILGKEVEEQEVFFRFIQELLDTNVSCKVILILREEFLADLWIFEKAVPSLFDHRFRVERMRIAQLEEVVSGTLNHFVRKEQLRVEEMPIVAAAILNRLNVDNNGVELTYLQVYLDQLYQLAGTETKTGLPVFDPGLINRLGSVEDVIGDFLDEQIQTLEKELDNDEQGFPIQLLGGLVSDEQTKKVLHMAELEKMGSEIGLAPDRLECFLLAFENMRILKRYTVKGDLKVELTHDIIAKKVWERLPEANKELRQIKKSLEQRFHDFSDGRGSLLGEKELNAWEYYFSKLNLDQLTMGYIRESKQVLEEKKQFEKERIEREKEQIAQNKRLQKRIGRGLILIGSIIGLLLILTLLARISLTHAQQKNIDFLLKESQSQIRNLQYENARSLLGSAYSLKKNNEEVGKGLMEVAFFYNETGHPALASIIIDTIAGIFKQYYQPDLKDQAAVREQLKALDETHFQDLERRYFPELLTIPGGTFVMGCDTIKNPDCFDNELPAYKTTVDDFQLARTETTVWQYYLFKKAVDEELPNSPSWGWIGDYPISNITWPQAKAYCNWLNEQRGTTSSPGFRLPSEKEWEYAAKNGPQNSIFIYSGSDQLDSVAWYRGNSESPKAVGTKKQNALGLYDLSGNVWEWCATPFDFYPLPADTVAVSMVTEGVLRGGAYDSYEEEPTTTGRLPMDPTPAFNAPSYGFRVAKN